MKPHRFTFILSLLLAGVFSDGHSLAAEPPIAGGYSSQKETKESKSAAEFAVKAQSKRESAPLKLLAIVKAETQVVAGINYRLTLAVKIGDANRTATAVVYRNLQSQFSLTSWEWKREKK